MTIKSLKKFTELLNRSEGISILPIIVIMVVMSIMGGVFTSIMGGWKISAPMTINSNKAYYLAETAAMFALQDAKNRFFSKSVDDIPDFPSLTTGTRLNTFEVVRDPIVNPTEIAEFWIERPASSVNPSVDVYPGTTDRGLNDDDDSSSDDDVVDDDFDDPGNPSLYTIIATGKVLRNGTTVAKRQIKIKATITESPANTVPAGISTEGNIGGTGVGTRFDITNNDIPKNVTYDKLGSPTGGTDEDQLVYRTPIVQLDENIFKSMADSQGHYFSTGFNITNGYPNGQFFFNTGNTVPNITYVTGDLDLNGNVTIWGVYWVQGNVEMDGTGTINGIIISEGNITMNGGGAPGANLDGGIIQYGAGMLQNNSGPATDITINTLYFNALNSTIPIVTVQSWQEAVSAN